MSILFMLFCAVAVYLLALAIAYPLQYILFYGAALLKSYSILPETMEYTMDMAMHHTENILGALLIAVIAFGVLKLFGIVK